jgi:ribosomal protein S18 acetylase RimI-like enzyme
MAIRSRAYTDDDLPQLQAALALWIQEAGACGYCHVGGLPHRIYENLRGRHPLGQLVQVWEDDRSIVGIAINFRFDIAFDVFTCPSYRGTDVELRMLQSAYATTLRCVKQLEREDTSVVTDVYSCDDARMELLQQLGFEEYRLWDHITERSLSGSIPEWRLPDGFTIRPATMDDYAQLAGARNDAFSASWSPEMYRDQVMRKPGYQPEREIVVVAADGRIAAFTVIWLDQLNKVGQFEPVGTRRDFQRRGLARAMMLYALGEMKRLGLETATVEHDASNLAALELYRGLGFRKKYETLGYRRL